MRYRRNQIVFPQTPLYLGSRPSPCREMSLEGVDTGKRVHCRRYRNCLDHACGKAWTGFTCLACPIEDPLSHEAQRDDDDGICGLLTEIFGPKPFYLSNR